MKYDTRISILSVVAATVMCGCTCQNETKYYDNGRPHETTTFYMGLLGNHIEHGPCTAWYDNGQMWRQVEFRNGLKEGEFTEWYSDGTKSEHGYWKKGRETGLWKAWHRTGEKRWEAVYKEGRIIGNRTFWSNDKMERVDYYGDDGVIDKLETLYPNGDKAIQGNYSRGQKHGSWTYWFPDGRIKASGEWKDGKPWSGVCAIPVPGDAGSWGGIEVFKVYKDGVEIGRASLPADSATTTAPDNQ